MSAPASRTVVTPSTSTSATTTSRRPTTERTAASAAWRTPSVSTAVTNDAALLRSELSRDAVDARARLRMNIRAWARANSTSVAAMSTCHWSSTPFHQRAASTVGTSRQAAVSTSTRVQWPPVGMVVGLDGVGARRRVPRGERPAEVEDHPTGIDDRAGVEGRRRAGSRRTRRRTRAARARRGRAASSPDAVRSSSPPAGRRRPAAGRPSSGRRRRSTGRPSAGHRPRPPARSRRPRR